jgi:hypothetical protein
MINTPITSDSSGNLFFGFQVIGAVPLPLDSGIARISSSGTGTWIAAAVAANDPSITKVVHNCTPALSLDGSTVYVAVSNGSAGYLVALDSTTLTPKASVALTDPKSGSDSSLADDGSASPTVGPDGDVYFGVLENPFPENNDRGWLLHFNGTLSQSKIPGAFGWDYTAAVVPSSLVSSYHGTSTYLLMSKYNNYANLGGNGQNKIAVLDPNAAETDPVTGATVMQEVLTILGPTQNPSLPGVKEWCINSAAVDQVTKAVMANSEDGKLYRWDLTSNTLSQTVTLTSGLGEAYTPTVIGVDGTVYAINNAILFAVGTLSATAPDFTISRLPTSVSVVKSSNGSSTITTAVSGGFNSALALSATGQPKGVTASFNPTSIAAPGSGTSTMTVAVASNTATGTYPIAVTGTGGGLKHTTVVTLTVTVPDFTIRASPTTISVARGKSGITTITTARLNGFSSAITLSAFGHGSARKVDFSPNPIAAMGSAKSAMTVTVSGSATIGTRTITIKGKGGAKTRKTTVVLMVTKS